MAQDTLLGFPAHTLPYRRRRFSFFCRSTEGFALLFLVSAGVLCYDILVKVCAFLPGPKRAEAKDSERWKEHEKIWNS